MATSAYPRTFLTVALLYAAVLFTPAARASSAEAIDCAAYAGAITTDSTQQCLVNGSATLVAVPGGDAVIPPGYQIGYVLTRTNGLTIAQVGPNPTFTVSSVDAWRIHSLVYDPTTLDFAAILDLDHAYQLQAMLVQGGGNICASLNISGAFTKTTECPQGCTADAGTISALNPDQCLSDGNAQLEALPDGNALVPAGFSVLHVLTTGPDLLIVAVGSEPSFQVTTEGPYIIHTLVYDPATLDLSGIVFGETSAFEIAALLQQGGGPICGSLDTDGAQFEVVDCSPVCSAYAGTLTAVAGEVCLLEGMAELEAHPNGDAVIPDGYSVAYILARSNGIIENVEPVSLFEWALTGEYVIHALIYDPFTLDPYDVILGTTTISDLNALLIQGGGAVCGSLDLTGAQFIVIECAPPCAEDAGIGGDRILCYTDPVVDLFQLLIGSPDEGGTWTGPGGQPFAGLFDPASDAQGIYIYFVTDGPDCPGDTAQLVIDLIECGDPCNAFAGADAETIVCTNEQAFSMFLLLGGEPWTGGSWTGPDGAPHPSIFVPASDAPGDYTYTVGDVDPCPGDQAVVHVSVTQAPNAGMDGMIALCSSGTPVDLGSSSEEGGTWYGPDGAAHSGILLPESDPAGTYIYVVDGMAPCANDTASVVVSISIAPDAGTSAQVSVCDTDAPFNCFASLGGVPDQGGFWTGPDGAPFSGMFDPETDAPGIHIYTALGTAPCLNETATLLILVAPCCTAGEDAEATVCFTDPPFLMFDLLGGNPCPGGSWTDPPNQAHSGVFNPAVDASGIYTYTVVGEPGQAALVSTLTISVIECPNTCEADAGTLFNDEPEVCLQGGSAVLASMNNGDVVIPAGYISAFLLSSGPELTLIALENSPFFIVTSPGLYTIHTLVYDPNTLDLSAVELGNTTGGDVNVLLIQGGGNICASLDVAGAQFLVSECADPCAASTPDAGIGGDIIICDTDPATELFALLQGTPDPGGFFTGPDGEPFDGFFDPMTDAEGVYVYTVFDLPDCEPDTTQLNMDVVGCEGGGGNLVAWPNPSVDVVTFQFDTPVNGSASIVVIDATGRLCHPPVSIDGKRVTLRVANMPAGSYSLRMLEGAKQSVGRFVRAAE